MNDYPELCENCGIGQLNLIAKTKNQTGETFVLFKCFMCDSILKLQSGLLTIHSKGKLYNKEILKH